MTRLMQPSTPTIVPYTGLMQIPASETLIAATSGPQTAGASAQLVGANVQRQALGVYVDAAAANPIYLLLGTGTASATNFHVCLAPTKLEAWDGRLGPGGPLWRGAVQFFSAAGNKVGVVEA